MKANGHNKYEQANYYENKKKRLAECTYAEECMNLYHGVCSFMLLILT